jgi:radical SAM superfamily enzyme YgiQ (UPF0313 family)
VEKQVVKILLIYPKFPDTFWSFKYALSFIGKKSAFPPLGLLTVASLLPEAWAKRLRDVNVEKLTDKDLAWADMVFIGGMAVQRNSAEAIIDRCKKMDVPIVAGGPLFTAEPKTFDSVDYLVLDEAEITLPQFLEDFENGRARRIYRADRFAEIDQSPIPSWELIQSRRYGSMNIQFSRGCPFDCDFCNVTELFGHKPRMKSPEQIIAELDCIYNSGWRSSIFFVDDNFIGNKGYLKKKLLPELIKWRRGKKGCIFFTEASINLADDEALMTLMVEAGFDAVFIGIESPDDASLAECKKHQNMDRDLVEDVKKIQRFGLQVMGGFIVGFDSDTTSIFQRQIDFIKNSNIVTAMVGMLQAPPGTRLFDRLNLENRINNLFSGDNVDGSTNIIPAMGMERLLEGYRSIMKQIYSPKEYYRRIKSAIMELKETSVKMPLDIRRIIALVKSSYRLGIIGKERLQYWKLMLWILLRKPRRLHLAVTMAIYGYHYRRICELYIY